jgi:hypothetical protein
MPRQKIVDRAVAGFVADRFFISRFEIVDVSISPAPTAL